MDNKRATMLSSEIKQGGDAPIVDMTNLDLPDSVYDKREAETNYVAMETDGNDPFSNDATEDSVASSVMTASGLADPLGFFIICCVVLIGDMNRGVLFPIMWPLVQELGGNAVWLGYAVGAFSFGRIIASPTLGKMSIDYGYSKTLVISTAIIIFGCLLFGSVYRVGSLYFLVFAQVVLGIGSGTLGVTRAYVAEITATRERTKYIALQTAVQYGGFTVTPIFGSFFIWVFDEKRYEVGFFVFDQYSAASYFMGGLGIVTLFLLLTKFQARYRTKPASKKKSSRTAERDEVADRVTFAGVTVYTAALLGCMLLNVSTKGSIGAFETMGVSFAESHFGLEPATAGLVVSINGMIGVAALLSMGHLGKVFTDIQMILGGIMVCALGIISFAPLESVEDGGVNSAFHYCIGIFMIYAIGYPIGHTAVIGLFSKVVGRRPQGTLQGYFASAGSLARILFPVMSGYIISYDSINTVMVVLFVNLIIANIFVAVSSKTLEALSV